MLFFSSLLLIGTARALQLYEPYTSQKDPQQLNFNSDSIPSDPLGLDFDDSAYEVRSAQQLTWLHIPKCGTSFVNTLVTWACPDLADDDLVSPDDVDGPENGPAVWIEAHSTQCDHYAVNISAGHDPMPDPVALENGIVTMLRQPEQRIISGYHHHKWGYRGSDKDNLSFKGYGAVSAGCSTRMLTGKPCMADEGPPENVTWEDVSLAVDRLKTNFAFIGLSDEWDLSVCLFHKMFGSDCHKREFINIRQGKENNGTGYDISVLEGFTDEYDNVVYSEAVTLFWANIYKYNVTEEKCQEECFTVGESQESLEQREPMVNQAQRTPAHFADGTPLVASEESEQRDNVTHPPESEYSMDEEVSREAMNQGEWLEEEKKPASVTIVTDQAEARHVDSIFKPAGENYCMDGLQWDGFSSSPEDCRAKCRARDKCKYASIWETNYCRLTSSCSSITGAGRHMITIWQSEAPPSSSREAADAFAEAVIESPSATADNSSHSPSATADNSSHSPSVTAAFSVFKPLGRNYCVDGLVWDGYSSSADSCRAQCSADATCKFASVWEGSYCRLTSSCKQVEGDGDHMITVWTSYGHEDEASTQREEHQQEASAQREEHQQEASAQREEHQQEASAQRAEHQLEELTTQLDYARFRQQQQV